MLTVGTAQVADAVDLYVRVHNCVEQAGPGCVTNEHSQSSSSIWKCFNHVESYSAYQGRTASSVYIILSYYYIICVWLSFIQTWTPCWPPAEWGNDVWWTGGFSLKWNRNLHDFVSWKDNHSIIQQSDTFFLILPICFNILVLSP